MKNLFNTFPREFGVKRTFVTNQEDFKKLINQFNGIKDCYSSLYPVISKGKRNITSIDKMFFDFDNVGTCWESTLKLHRWLIKHQYKHVILLSGGGFHIYVYTTKTPLIYAKNALKTAQHYITKQANVTIGKPKESDVDEHVIGDIARIARIPNTYNMKRKRFCIYILPEDLNKTFDELKTLAKNQRKESHIFGNKLFDIIKFDTKPIFIETIDLEVSDTPVELKNVNGILKLLPPFIRGLLLNHQCGWEDRKHMIIAMREVGLTYNMILELCRKYWTPEKFQHAMISEENQIRYVYHRQDLYFSKWQTLIEDGYMITKDDLKFKFYGD